MNVNHAYADLLSNLLSYGDNVYTRNSEVKRLHTYTYIFDKCPLISLRQTAWKSALEEMRWFLSGSNNINDLSKNVQKWWQPWADKLGVIKFNYGEQFRHFTGGDDGYGGNTVIDQLESFIYGIKKHPFSRRNVITTWNPPQMWADTCPITNCHGTIIQAFVRPGKLLDITMYQRSVDVICGLPHNWIQYWAFLQWVANVTEHKVGSFYWVGGDIHLYRQHFELAEKLVSLAEKHPVAASVQYTMRYSPAPNETQFKPADFSLTERYFPMCSDPAEMIV